MSRPQSSLVQSLLSLSLSLSLLCLTEPSRAFAAPPGAVKDFAKLSATEGGLGVIPNQKNFGVSVAAADINGDGVKDYAVGDYYDDDGGSLGALSNVGAVHILFMSADGTVASRTKISATQGGFGGLPLPESSRDGANFGYAIAALGDLNDDGVEDLIVGAISVDNPGAVDSGAIFVLFLNAAGTVSSFQKIAPGVGGFAGTLEPSSNFGSSFAVLGDLTGDGTREVAVGDNDVDGHRGRVYILSLHTIPAAGTVGTVASSVKIGPNEGGFTGSLDSFDEFATSLASVGDLDGNGVADLAVGAYENGLNPGRIYLLRLKADRTVDSFTVLGNAELGGVLAADGDGFGVTLARMDPSVGVSGSEVVLAAGAILDDDGGTNVGAVYLISLGTNGTFLGIEKISLESGCLGPVLHPNDQFGAALASPGDLDGDGVADLVVTTYNDGASAQGAVHQLYLEGTPTGSFAGGPEIRVSDDPVDTSLTNYVWPQIASSGAGSSLIAWWGSVGADDNEVFGRVLSGGVLGAESTLSEPAAGLQFSPAVVATNDGYLLGFTSNHLGPPARRDVFLRQVNPDGSPVGGSIRVNTEEDCNESMSTGGLTRDATGTISLVWSARACASVYGPNIETRARVYDASLNPLGDPLEVASSGHVSDVAPLGSGTFVSIYRAPDVLGQRYDETQKQGPEFQLETASVSRESNQPNAVVGLAGGSFVAFWSGYLDSNGNGDVFGRRFDPPSYAGGDPFYVNEVAVPDYDAHGGNLQAAVLPDGNIAVAWVGFDADGAGIFSRVLDPYGAPLSDVLAVNTTTAGRQELPDVAPRPDGGFTIVWSGAALDGQAVFAREFAYSVCGDATVAGNEQCDDGNTTNNDGCNSRCITEPEISSCADTDTCNGAEVCDEDGLCQAGDPAEADTPCDDGDPQTSNDVCDGNGVCNPVVCGDGFVAVGAEECDDSNALAGDCCSATCTFEGPGSSCADADVCGGTETCDGSGTCQDGVPADGGTYCDDGDPETPVDVCDGAGTCTPVVCGDGSVAPVVEGCDDGNTESGDCCSSNCTFETAGSTCGDPTDNVCSNPDTCDGVGTCVPNHEPSTTECRAAAGECDAAESCDGLGACLADGFVSPATPCTDSLPNDCKAAQCDGSGSCNQTFANETTGSSCDDDLYCNGNSDTCDASGGCTNHGSDPCPGPDGDGDCSESCDEISDNCSANDTNGSSCSDGLFCTENDTCDAGVCSGADPCPGPDGDGDCAESCNEASDDCSAHDTIGSACDDGLYCTADDTCSAGSCVGAGDPCPGPDDDGDCSETCNESSDECTSNDPDGSSCDGNGEYDCSGADTCVSGACESNDLPADTECSDGSDLTCPDACDGSGTCVPGNHESTDCRNTCCDGVDNDGDLSTDIEDSGCGLGQESRTAVVTTSPKRNAIRMGGRVNIASLDLEIDRPDCDEPYIYRTEAGICGERMSLRKNGEVGFIATLATPAVSGSQPVVFGKGFDIRSHWVSNGDDIPAESQEPPPLVGPGTCNPGGESCTQPLTPLNPGDACPSASAGACCPNPSALCEGRMDLFDPNNPYVITDGSHPDYARCQALRTELAASSDAVAALAPNHPNYSDVVDPERIRVLPSNDVSDDCDDIGADPNACTAACASACNVILGAGQIVLYVDSIDVKRNMAFRICRDFNLTPSDPPTVAIFRIEDSFKLSPGARIESCGVPPDRILWNAEGDKGSVKFARGADLIGTVLAPRRKSIKFGGDATLKGSLFAPIVTFSKFTEMYHYPFSAGIE